MATASSHRMPQAHEALGRASRNALPVPVGRRATQVWPSALPRNRVASARPDNAEARQARMVATRFHECAMGAQGHRLSGEVRHEDCNIGGPVSEGLPTARSRWSRSRTARLSLLVDASEVSTRTLRACRSRVPSSRWRLALSCYRRVVGVGCLLPRRLAAVRPSLLAIRLLSTFCGH